MTTPAEAEAAAAAGADTVEVCTWLASGGLTPSSGLVAHIAQHTRLPVRVLVRPVAGGFHYGADVFSLLLREIEALRAVPGAAGVVTGMLMADHRALAERSLAIHEACGPVPWTFHRAIDHATDPLAVMEAALAAGAARILTSGGAPSALEGTGKLAELVRHANGRCIIAAAAGIGPANVVEIVERTGVGEVHFSAQRKSNAAGIALASGAEGHWAVEPDRAKIDGVLNALVKAGLR